MDTLKSEIEGMLLEMGRDTHEVLNKKAVLSILEKRYVSGTPRVWWLSLKHITRRIAFDDNTGYKYLEGYIDKLNKQKRSTQFVYFIADDNDLLVYKVSKFDIVKLVGGCRFFEYYISPVDFSWLICETDHGEVIICEYQNRMSKGC